MEPTEAHTGGLERRTITALGLLSVFLGVLPQLYAGFGWPDGHRLAGTVLAVAVFGGGAAIARRIGHQGRRMASNAVMALALVGAAFLPYVLHATLVVAARPDPVAWMHGNLLTVPELADDEPVRGTGCGAHSTTRVTPTTIPNGTWFGAIRSVERPASLTFDLICVYDSEARAVTNPSYAAPDTASGIVRFPASDPVWVAINASSKVRVVPMASNFRYREAAWTSQDGCHDERERDDVRTDVGVWLVIESDRAVLAVKMCDLDDAPAG